MERPTIGVAEHGHGPAAPAGQSSHSVHVDRVDVWALLPIDLNVDKPSVHLRGNVGVLKRLVSHDVAPVAGRVADTQEDGYVPLDGCSPGLLTPRIPVDGVVGVLAKVGAGLTTETVHNGDPTTGRLA